MSYPFVRSYVQGGAARGPRLAVVWHMAEGGGTVGYLSRQNPNGVSVHFVVEYDGSIVQMLRLDQMHTSIRSSDIRTTDDNEPSPFGATAARWVMGAWADIRRTLGPNHASIGVEVEGFAKDGPNAKQQAAIAELFGYLANLYPDIRSLGHRDFADYKACPGQHFPWAAVGGHGPAPVTESADVKFIQATGLDRLLLHLPSGTPLYGFDGDPDPVTVTSSERDWPYVGLADAKGGEYVVVAGTKAPYPDGVTRPTLLVARTGTIVEAPEPEPQTVEVTISANGKVVGTVNLP